MINFIGIGAQRAGTSWTYACLYEHPEICIPVKEIHFFSRPRYVNGISWYEDHFKRCKVGSVCGEFSTSYLYSEDAPTRIHKDYPDAKIIAILRNPIDRALSQYGNAVKGGEIEERMSFEEYYRTERSVLEQGRYAEQLARYYALFPSSQILVVIYEDNKKDPGMFIKKVYGFLGVRSDFVPSMLHDVVNVTRVPKSIGLEKRMHYLSEWLRRHGLDQFVHLVRRSGLPELVRTMNTKKKKNNEQPVYDREALVSCFRDDVTKLSALIGRDMNAEWDI